MQSKDESLQELIESLVNDQATKNQFVELKNRLESSREARLEYIEYLTLHAELRRHCMMANDPENSSLATDLDNWLTQPPKTANPAIGKTIPLPIALPFAALAAALLFALTIFLGRETGTQSDLVGTENSIATSDPFPDSEKNSVAVLTHSVNATWTHQLRTLQPGDSIQPGTIDLADGVLRIEFYKGASLILEGPALFEVVDSNSGFIHRGKLRVMVPERAKGFAIDSPRCKVLDLGTEFAMNVSGPDHAEVHVIDGEVHVSEPAKSENITRLTTGRGVEYPTMGEAREIPTDESQFVGPAEMRQLSTASFNEDLERWRLSAEMIRKDPATIAFYSFQEADDWDRSLVNSALNTAGSGDGAIVGCKWKQGRWPGKRGLEYSSPSHRVRLNLPERTEAITLACWVKFASLPRHSIALMHPDTDQDEYLHWSIAAAGNGSCFLHFSLNSVIDGKSSRIHYGSGNQSITKGDIGEWTHLAVTYDPDSKVVNHFQNGIRIGSSTIKKNRPISIGAVEIGNWPYKEWADGTVFEERNLNGTIDEFLIMRKALSLEDMKSLYEQGKP